MINGTCNESNKNESNCNNNGECISNTCICNNSKYYGEYCQFTYCFEINSNENKVCSNQGKCIDYNKCQCSKTY
jgi:hypothetical protein